MDIYENLSNRKWANTYQPTLVFLYNKNDFNFCKMSKVYSAVL